MLAHCAARPRLLNAKHENDDNDVYDREYASERVQGIAKLGSAGAPRKSTRPPQLCDALTAAKRPYTSGKRHHTPIEQIYQDERERTPGMSNLILSLPAVLSLPASNQSRPAPVRPASFSSNSEGNGIIERKGVRFLLILREMASLRGRESVQYLVPRPRVVADTLGVL